MNFILAVNTFVHALIVSLYGFFFFRTEREFSPRETLRQKAFYKLWFMYLFNGQGINFISSLYKVYLNEIQVKFNIKLRVY